MLVADVWDWFTTGSHWTGTDGIPNRLLEHVSLCAEVMLVAGLMALPIALTLGHVGRGGFLAINISNIGRAIPFLRAAGAGGAAVGARTHARRSSRSSRSPSRRS